MKNVHSFNWFIFQTEPKVSQKLEIFAIDKTPAEEVKLVETFPDSKTVKLFPAVFQNERQAVLYFAEELVNDLAGQHEVKQNQVKL